MKTKQNKPKNQNQPRNTIKHDSWDIGTHEAQKVGPSQRKNKTVYTQQPLQPSKISKGKQKAMTRTLSPENSRNLITGIFLNQKCFFCLSIRIGSRVKTRVVTKRSALEAVEGNGENNKCGIWWHSHKGHVKGITGCPQKQRNNRIAGYMLQAFNCRITSWESLLISVLVAVDGCVH